MSTLSFSLTVAESLYNSDEQFPVNFADLWVWCGYSNKRNAADKLKNSFDLGVDFIAQRVVNTTEQGFQAGRPSDEYYLTIDCSKMFAMMARTEKGKEVRKYFLQCEQALKERARTAGLLISAEPELDAAKAIAEIHQNVEYISPRIAQRLIDARLNRLDREQGNLALPPSESPLLGAVEIAEDLGYKPESNHWSSLGRCVAKAYRDAGLGEPAKEKRICNGRMTEMKVYPSNEPIVREAIHQFYRLRIKSA